MNGRPMTKEEAVAHMKKMMERVSTAELMLHLEVIGQVVAERQAKELEGKNFVFDIPKGMQ